MQGLRELVALNDRIAKEQFPPPEKRFAQKLIEAGVPPAELERILESKHRDRLLKRIAAVISSVAQDT